MMKGVPIAIDAIICKGGLDQITPTLSLASGAARQALNFECSVTGGYTRIKGYERYDGRTAAPSVMADAGAHRFITFVSLATTPQLGQVVTANTGATGVVAMMTGTTLVLAKITETAGTWDAATTADIGTIATVYGTPATAAEEAQARNAVADIYRADIGGVPGSGPIRGVVALNDILYAFRDAAQGDAGTIYQATAAGWVRVPTYRSVGFTEGTTAIPADGATLTQGAVTATVKRVVRESGAWGAAQPADQASGRLIITTPQGGSFTAGAATLGAATVTLAGADTAITIAPGGWYEFAVTNFYGQATTTRIYGCNGTGPAFEFDGDVYVPLHTGMPEAVDKPDHIVAHNGYLMLGLKSSLMYSTPGDPYDWRSGQAGEIATGADITGFITMPGGTSQATLGVLSRDNTFILYGPTDNGTAGVTWNFVPYNTGTGAAPRTAQNMAQTFVFDDRGVNSIQATLSYGNFSQTALTSALLPFIAEHVGTASASTLCRKKSQYRLFFSDGYGLFVTVVNNKPIGCMPVYFPHAVTCCYEGKTAAGADVIYFGSDSGDGMVYQMEKGTSFDGADISYYLTLNYSNAKQPRTLKRYRKIAPEVTSEGNAYAQFDLTYRLGFGSSEYSQDIPRSYSQATTGLRWDTTGATWDRYQWDLNALTPVESYADGTAENIAIVINGNADYVDAFTLNSFLVHYSPRRMMR